MWIIYYVFVISMKKFVRPLISLVIVIIGTIASLALAQVMSSRYSANNNVPDYYYANYKFSDDWDALLEWFIKAEAKYSIGQSFSTSEFVELSRHFDKVFPNLTKDYTSVYEKCKLLASSLSRSYSYTEMEALMWNTCYRSLITAINTINSSYTVQPSVTATPGWWMAPLTVTFDARNSSDPSMETIPTDNFYWYYRDEKWVDRPIWQWQVLSYTFEESGKFVVHMTVRSSNVDKWILDWERDLIVNVTPKAADIVVYANTRRMSQDYPLKIWTSEWEKWVVFDGSLTRPRWWRKILRNRWTITNSSADFSYDSKYKDGAPTYINVPLKWNWLFKITLTTQDNENNTVSESFDLYMSDPVTIIRQSPEEGTTSTTFNFDGSASYSITNRLSTYIWEVFDWNWDAENWNKIQMVQWKQMKVNENNRLRPWNYLVRLTVTDEAWNTNVETKNLYVESTTPMPQFTVTPTSKWTNPSEFTLNASNTLDVDVDNGVDSLEYEWAFSTDAVDILSTENNNQKIVVRFNEKWTHTIKLTVTDQYWKTASVSKDVDVNSTLRPEIELIPWPITWGNTMQFKSTVNREVWDYTWDFWDESSVIESEGATDVQHVYWHKWIYSVKLTVTDQEGDSNTVLEKAFIWEVKYPIAAYDVMDSEWFKIQSSDVCIVKDESWRTRKEVAYPVDRYSKITIDWSKSVNTQWTSNGLQYVFEKETVLGSDKDKATKQFTTSFNETGCHYVHFILTDSLWKQDTGFIRFNVKNALPKVKNVSISIPQLTENQNTIWFTSSNDSAQQLFACSWGSNITIKVTAVDASDPDWNISRLKFYYYNADDSSRILEYKETWLDVPYVYFVVPKVAWEYKFGVMVYDNDDGRIDSNEYLASNPSLYIPAVCENSGVPIVTLKVDRNNIQVGDEVEYSIVSRISSDDEDFKVDRVFYYDFTWDWSWDLVTKKDTVSYIFNEAYDDWILPRAGVEYRWKLWQTVGKTIFVKNGIKPILLYNSIWNTVIFRDLSVWILQKKEICFEKSECEAWNTKFRRIYISKVSPDELTWGTKTSITENDYSIRKYDDYWNHDVSVYLKSKYAIEVKTWFTVKTSNNSQNWQIAPWVNMITIPETTLTNENPEIFLSKRMDDTLIMYINNDSWEECFVDIDTATDSDGNGKPDDDRDVLCNKIAKIKYEPDYESTIGSVYFTNNGKLTFKNFYVTFEWIVSWLDDEKKEIYEDITTLINWIEDKYVENTNLKKSLDRLRKSLNNRMEIASLLSMINEEKNEKKLRIDEYQMQLLESIISRLANEDTVISVWISEYEKNKREILALIDKQSSLKHKVEEKFQDFDENMNSYTQEQKAKELEGIWNVILEENKKSKIWYDETDFNFFFCNIFDYFDVSMYTKKCNSTAPEITNNYNKSQWNPSSASEKSWWFPWWLKVILIILVWWLLVMWWVIVFFSIKAKLSSSSESDDEW